MLPGVEEGEGGGCGCKGVAGGVLVCSGSVSCVGRCTQQSAHAGGLHGTCVVHTHTRVQVKPRESE